MGSELAPDILLSNKIANEIDAQYLASEKVKARFGWIPRVGLDEGLEKTISWYRKNWA